jgi:H+/Cl- antiporter ClcA
MPDFSDLAASPAVEPSRRLSAKSLLHWALVLLTMSAAVGSACAFFLWSLDLVTRFRFAHSWLLFLLPVGGAAVGFVYHRYGRDADRGNNLLMDRIHEPGGGVPRRMAPLVLLGTLITHLFGGSAGREGTAVQMGGSIAAAFCRWFRCDAGMIRVVLMGGISAGFSAVFGTPLAGTIFALEVLTIGSLEYRALLPCFVCAITADWVCRAWSIGHTHYHVGWLDGATDATFFFRQHWTLFPKIAVAAVAFGLASRLFAFLSHWLSGILKAGIPNPTLRPVVGGVAVIALFFISGTPDYLGLGVISSHPGAVTLPSFFTSPEIHPWAWLWKLVFTVVTLSSGFKGGEVTPLFFIGAALGNALAGWFGVPTDLFAALGFVAIFAGATNTPLACTLMGIELFGAGLSVPLACACFIAYLCSGNKGIYTAQRLGNGKNGFGRRWRGRSNREA